MKGFSQTPNMLEQRQKDSSGDQNRKIEQPSHFEEVSLNKSCL